MKIEAEGEMTYCMYAPATMPARTHVDVATPSGVQRLILPASVEAEIGRAFNGRQMPRVRITIESID